ncbi:acetoacetate decarboxylase family protein [Halopiger aswanensis]|uniref:Acetoacetate decarboxylase n=1 Tax=Halopiger aswanensis TaxID=148449 RepID=A0A3R7GLZ9_9EURY|nr:acetoacetate decarboxylase family protein [Halopiger aswanensis]RKD98348.1 acetoacetate decarboxylase [Halopiger aswanensis]
MSADPPHTTSRSDGDRSRVRLSTGHTVSLPLELSFAMGGVVVPARRRRLEAALPSALEPLAIAPGIGCVALVGIRYRRVGRGDEAGDGAGLEPYDEFAVIVPAVRGARTSVPLAQALDGELGGYVHWLPVTTDASVALGREIWGYPKERVALTVADTPRGMRIAVSRRDGSRGDDAGDGDDLAVRLEVLRPLIGGRRRDLTLRSYSITDGALHRAQARIRGEIAIGSPVGANLCVASELASELGLWRRPIARLYGADVRARLEAGDAVE